MPSKWSMVDSSFPTFRGDEKPAQQIAMLTDYMFVLVEELKYQLANLDTENWNGTALKDFQSGTTADLDQQVSTMAARLALVAGEVAALTGRVVGLEKLREQMQGMEIALGELEEAEGLQWSTIDELAAELEMMEEIPDRVEELEKLPARVDALGAVLVPDEQGGGTLGAQGRDLYLQGNVYINGRLITEEEML